MIFKGPARFSLVSGLGLLLALQRPGVKADQNQTRPVDDGGAVLHANRYECSRTRSQEAMMKRAHRKMRLLRSTALGGVLITALLAADGALWPFIAPSVPEVPDWTGHLLLLAALCSGLLTLRLIRHAPSLDRGHRSTASSSRHTVHAPGIYRGGRRGPTTQAIPRCPR